jgi:hypothetical protein
VRKREERKIVEEKVNIKITVNVIFVRMKKKKTSRNKYNKETDIFTSFKTTHRNNIFVSKKRIWRGKRGC